MKKIRVLLYFSIFAVLVSGCDNNTKDPVTEQDCFSNVDCPLGYFCNLSIGKCASLSSDADNVLPDSNDLPGEDSEKPDSDSFIPKGDVTCDCFGKNYIVPGKFESIQGWCKADDDGDGIPNCIEVANGVPVDTDEDTTPDYLDTDSDKDGISDDLECVEIPCRDTDSDGVPDYRDDDSDGDSIIDSVECFSIPCVDSDEDGTVDYLDTDSDDDGVPDLIETEKDKDKDGIPNFLDDDSDGDLIPDGEECSVLPCADSDGDGVYDFIDQDADGDGLPDNQEVPCPNLGIHSRTKADTDGDGFSDLAEILVGSDPCNNAEGVFDKGVKFYFELPYKGEEKNAILTFAPTVKKADVAFNVDTTGSMGGEIGVLKTSLNSIINQTKTRITDSAFAVTHFRDDGESLPTIKCHPTTDAGIAQGAVNGLGASGGGDCAEAGYWSLYQAVNGLTWRAGTIPIFVHITDASTHERGGVSGAASLAALQAKGAKVITVLSGGGCEIDTARSQLTSISNSTGAVVPACAGAGRTTLLYDIDGSGNGLGEATVNGIDALIKYATFSIYVQPVDDGDGATIDTACFLKKVEADSFEPVDSCAPVATAAQFNGSTFNNGFINFSTGTSSAITPGNKLKFKVFAQNDTCFESTGVAKLFKAYINVIDSGTGAVLDTQEVTIIVPGKVSGSDA